MLKNILSSYQAGWIAEYYTMLFLLLTGHKIIKHRFKNPQGEVDLITVKNKIISFVEVKLVKKLDANFPVISYNQIKRIKKGAQLFLKTHPQYNGLQIKFACAIVIWPKIKYLNQAF